MARKKPTPPRFKSWTGEGKVVVQLQKGLSTEDCLAGADSRLRVEPVEGGIWVSGSRKQKSKDPVEDLRLDSDGYPMHYLGDAWVYMRIASTNKEGQIVKFGRNPVWCKFPISLHRPLPPKAQIKWAWLRRRRIGLREHWEFQVVLAEDTRVREPDLTLASDGHVAVDVGWRLMASEEDYPCGFNSSEHDEVVHATDCYQSGLRIAYWLGVDGQEGELRLSARWLCAYYKVRDISSIRDNKFNEALESLHAWIKGREVPQWLTEAMKYSDKWRRKGRLAKVALLWRSQRFDGDSVIYAVLEAWRKQDKHLLSYESGLRERLFSQRKDIYRKFVADLRKRYATVVLEDIDMRALAKRKEPEDSHLEKGSARLHRSAAAISILRGFFKEKMKVKKVNPAGTSYLCNNCGCAAFRDSAEIKHTCSFCGMNWDRDANAARNILERGIDRVASATAVA